MRRPRGYPVAITLALFLPASGWSCRPMRREARRRAGSRLRRPNPNRAADLERCREQARDGKGVEQDQLVAEFEVWPDGFEPVAVEAGGEESGLAFLIGLIDSERRLRE